MVHHIQSLQDDGNAKDRQFVTALARGLKAKDLRGTVKVEKWTAL